jgi:hypothetical protein
VAGLGVLRPADPHLTRLPDGTYLSELRGKRKQGRVTVRVIEYSIRDDDQTSEVFALITNLVDPRLRTSTWNWPATTANAGTSNCCSDWSKSTCEPPAGSCDPAAPKEHAKRSGRCCASTKPYGP